MPANKTTLPLSMSPLLFSRALCSEDDASLLTAIV